MVYLYDSANACDVGAIVRHMLSEVSILGYNCCPTDGLPCDVIQDSTRLRTALVHEWAWLHVRVIILFRVRMDAREMKVVSPGR